MKNLHYEEMEKIIKISEIKDKAVRREFILREIIPLINSYDEYTDLAWIYLHTGIKSLLNFSQIEQYINKKIQCSSTKEKIMIEVKSYILKELMEFLLNFLGWSHNLNLENEIEVFENFFSDRYTENYDDITFYSKERIQLLALKNLRSSPHPASAFFSSYELIFFCLETVSLVVDSLFEKKLTIDLINKIQETILSSCKKFTKKILLTFMNVMKKHSFIEFMKFRLSIKINIKMRDDIQKNCFEFWMTNRNITYLTRDFPFESLIIDHDEWIRYHSLMGDEMSLRFESYDKNEFIYSLIGYCLSPTDSINVFKPQKWLDDKREKFVKICYHELGLGKVETISSSSKVSQRIFFNIPENLKEREKIFLKILEEFFEISKLKSPSKLQVYFYFFIFFI